MDSLQAYFRKQAAILNGNKMKELDWDKAKEIIEARNPKPFRVTAYLSEDYGWTAGVIFEDEKYIFDGGQYTSSLWATPMLLMEFETEEGLTDEEIPCWKFGNDQDPGEAWPNIRKETQIW